MTEVALQPLQGQQGRSEEGLHLRVQPVKIRPLTATVLQLHRTNALDLTSLC